MKNREKIIANMSSVVSGTISLAILVGYYYSRETVQGIIAIYLLILSVLFKMYAFHIKEDK